MIVIMGVISYGDDYGCGYGWGWRCAPCMVEWTALLLGTIIIIIIIIIIVTISIIIIITISSSSSNNNNARESVCAWAIGVARWLADGQTADTGLPLRDCIVKRRYARLGRGFLSPTALGDKNRRATRRHIHGGPLCQPCEPTKAFRVPCLVCGVACAAAVIGSRHVSAWLPRHTMP
jgi:uncharacterized membrane protein